MYTRSVRQVARALGVSEDFVVATAISCYPDLDSSIRANDFLFGHYQLEKLEGQIRGERGTKPEPASAGAATLMPVDKLREMAHPLWLHPEVTDAVSKHPALRKRLGLVLSHLAAHGRTSVVKGCKDGENSGWLRSPLGGAGGMHWYLWWTAKGNRPVKGIELPDRSIIVRAVRHHDTHDELKAGDLGDYLPLTQVDLEDDSIAGTPWTADQLEFVRSPDQVRILVGRPGSGKTTTLWKAIDAQPGERVLYLTWSSELTRSAREHFDTFAPVDVQIDTRDFLGFVSELIGHDVPRQTLEASQARFRSAISRLTSSGLGHWVNREDALFAEMRAYFLGRPTEEGGGHTHYLKERSDDIGKLPADFLVRISHGIAQSTLKEIFPELFAAKDAIQALKDGNVNPAFLAIDRVVIDEVQDLTLLETNLLVEFSNAVKRHRGKPPSLLVAGDDGQTVRPSGFEWGKTKDLFATIGAPKRFQLEDNLRCPDRLAEVIDRASAKYTTLSKKKRPTKQGKSYGGQQVDAKLIYVEVEDELLGVTLLGSISEAVGCAIISPVTDTQLLESHPDLKNIILSPAAAKGLEFQTVVILNPGRMLNLLETSVDKRAIELDHEVRRTYIDQLRVSLSRATETLIFLDVAPSGRERALSLELLGNPVRFDGNDLLDHFEEAESDPSERVSALTREALALLSEKPKRAWKRACQAMRMLGDPELPGAVSEKTVREEAYRTVLTTTANLLARQSGFIDSIGLLDVVHRSEWGEPAAEACRAIDYRANTEVLRYLEMWSTGDAWSAVSLLNSITSHESGAVSWVYPMLTVVGQTLREHIDRGAVALGAAGKFDGEVEEWLGLTGFPGDAVLHARALREKAFDTCIDASHLPAAERVLSRLEGDEARSAQMLEAKGDFSAAAEALLKLEDTEGAIRCYRAGLKWEEAAKLANESMSEHAEDLDWLATFDAVARELPRQIGRRISDNERVRLLEILDDLRKGLKGKD